MRLASCGRSTCTRYIRNSDARPSGWARERKRRWPLSTPSSSSLSRDPFNGTPWALVLCSEARLGYSDAMLTAKDLGGLSSPPPTLSRSQSFGRSPVLLGPIASYKDLGGTPNRGLATPRPELARLYSRSPSPPRARFGFGGNEPGNPSFYPLQVWQGAHSRRDAVRRASMLRRE